MSVIKMEESKALTPMGHEMRKKHFTMPPKHFMLNHGSFGTYPKQVQTQRIKYLAEAESRPDAFHRWGYQAPLLAARRAISSYLNVPLDTCVFVENATTAINVVLRNLVYQPNDVIVYFDTIYGSCELTLAYLVETTPVEIAKVEYEYPIEDEELVRLFRAKIRNVRSTGKKVKLAVFDTIVSQPGVRMPFERLAQVCREEEVMSCVDGAHGVGHIPLDIGKLNPDFFFSNCHKWLFTPRGSCVLYVPTRNQPLMRSSLPTSHGFVPAPHLAEKLHVHNPLPPSENTPFVELFDFVATVDVSPYLCIPAAFEFREKVCGGEQRIFDYIKSVARAGGDKMAEILGTEVLDKKGSRLRDCAFASVRLPLDVIGEEDMGKGQIPKEDVRAVTSWMQASFAERYDTNMALRFYKKAWWVRLSGMIYLEVSDFEYGAKVLKQLSEEAKRGGYKTRIRVKM